MLLLPALTQQVLGAVLLRPCMGSAVPAEGVLVIHTFSLCSLGHTELLMDLWQFLVMELYSNAGELQCRCLQRVGVPPGATVLSLTKLY